MESSLGIIFRSSSACLIFLWNIYLYFDSITIPFPTILFSWHFPAIAIPPVRVGTFVVCNNIHVIMFDKRGKVFARDIANFQCTAIKNSIELTAILKMLEN